MTNSVPIGIRLLPSIPVADRNVSGHVAERMNLRHFLSLGMICSGIMTVCFGLVWLSILLFRRGLIMGIWNSHTSVGNILGSLIAGAFVNYAWGWSFAVPGIIIGTLGIICFFVLVPNPEDVDCSLPDHEEKREPLIPSLNRSEDEYGSKGSEASLVPHKPTPSEHPPISIFRALMVPGVVEFSLCLFFAKLMYIYNLYGGAGLAYSIVLSLITGALVNGPYALITTAVSADLGTHKSLRGNARALATVTAIIDGTGSIGSAVGPLLAGVIETHGTWNDVFWMLIASDLAAFVMSLCQFLYKTKL
ncbi:hypothetical protein KUTeg_006255 [Tegillarca granosa]|uniref:Uncharacterized protein n=1 Tax=Tegillarca granosa TaxID=220873 RepID=A0ABQ9FJ94_TEGGR|nr:hypothetical protein KUTeg_006255 [Tegillarca granosa]